MRLWAALGPLPGLGSPRLLLSGALEGEPGSPTFVTPQSCHVCGLRGGWLLGGRAGAPLESRVTLASGMRDVLLWFNAAGSCSRLG